MQNLRFGLITDIQYCDGEPYMNRYLRETLHKTERVVDHFNREQLDFVVNLGDIIDKDYRSYPPILKVFEKCVHPVYHVAGNHDFEVEHDRKAQVLPLLNLPEKGYYDLDFGAWKFIVLNGNEISDFAHAPEHEYSRMAESWLENMVHSGRVNANNYNGGISTEQLKWLRGKISKADAEEQKVIVFCHFPIFPEDKHNLLNDIEIVRLLNGYANVKAWFCGHNHHGNYGKLKYCHAVNFKAIVDTKDELAYAIVECSENAIFVRGFGREHDRKYRLY